MYRALQTLSSVGGMRPGGSRTRPPRLSLLILTLAVLCGCREVETRFDVTSFKDPANPEQFTERFPPGAFAVDAHNNWDIVFVIPGTPIEVPQRAETDAAASQSADAADAVPRTRTVFMSQYVHMGVFWKPKPGTTYAESTQTNAAIMYCLVTGGNAISYEGAGFVYFTLSRDKKTITGRIESSTLVPSRTTKEPVDLFGSCRVEAWFVAREDRGRVVEVQQKIRRALIRPDLIPAGNGVPTP